MPITPKNWVDLPTETTPIDAAALEDVETRLGAYTDAQVAGVSGGTSADASTTVKGIAKIDPAPATATNPIAVGSNHSALTDTRTPTDLSVTNARVATGAAIAESKLALASDAAAGTASRRTLGTGATQAAAGNHAHSTLAPLASPTFTGTPAAPTAAGGTNTTQLATTAFVTTAVTAGTGADASTTVKGVTRVSVAPASATIPISVGDNDARVVADQAAGTASIRTLGTGALQAAAGNHAHATLAPLASPTFTGVPAAPTAAAATNTTQLATTAFVTTADDLKANLASPTFTGVPAAPTAVAGTDTTQLATTAFVKPLRPRVVAQGSSGTAFTVALGSDMDVIVTTTLTGNCTVTLTGLAAGARVTFIFTQDATGGRTVTLSPAPTGGNPAVAAIPNAVDVRVYQSTTGSDLREVGAAAGVPGPHVLALGDMTGTVACNIAGLKDVYVHGRLIGNSTVNITGISTACSMTFRIFQDATGGRTLTFQADAGASVVRWPGGTVPVMTAAANAIDVYTMFSNAGSSLEAFVVGKAMA